MALVGCQALLDADDATYLTERLGLDEGDGGNGWDGGCAGCDIGGECVASDGTNPANSCEACAPAMSKDSWTVIEGADCSQPSACSGDAGCPGEWLCNLRDGMCVERCAEGECEIDGQCVAKDTPKPSDGCRLCDPTADARGWSVAVGAECDDGDFCSERDVCLPNGDCAGVARTCDDSLACTRDRCDSAMARCRNEVTQGCAIDGACWADGDSSGRICQQCDASASALAWSVGDGGCQDGRSCTQQDACDPTGRCTGQPVDEGVSCPEGVCDAVGGCGGERIDGRASHTCLVQGGALHCFGRNHYGQLGDGTTVDRALPTRVGAAANWTQVVVGARHSCGTRDGMLHCWGEQWPAGAQQSTRVLSPLRVGQGADWGLLTAGAAHTCGLHRGALYCWGDNAAGQLGDGSGVRRASPTQVGVELDWTLVAAGPDHSCGLRQGALYCWGDNSWGQLGDGGYSPRDAPARVGVDAGWEAVSPGGSHTCGLRSQTLHCWGSNAFGQFGQATPADSPTPIAIGFLDDWQALSCGASHCCGIRADGDLYCWGRNQAGQLGDGTTEDSDVPVAIGTDFSAVTAGDAHTCGIAAGVFVCWGDGAYGQLGVEQGPSLTPQAVTLPLP